MGEATTQAGLTSDEIRLLVLAVDWPGSIDPRILEKERPEVGAWIRALGNGEKLRDLGGHGMTDAQVEAVEAAAKGPGTAPGVVDLGVKPRARAKRNGRKPSPVEDPDRLPLSETGNALRFRVHAEGDFLYVVETKGWFRWDGRRWARDVLHSATQRAIETIRELYGEAARTDRDEVRKKLIAFALKSEGATPLRGMLSIAATDPTFARQIGDFDRDPDTLNTASGLVDLRTGEFVDADRHRALVTKSTPIPFDPDAACPAWFRFLADVIPDADVIDFLQRAAGYSLTGHTREHVLFFLYGGGRNGKSTFLETLRAAMGEGEYAFAAGPDLLLSTGANRKSYDLASLRGARFVTTQEAPDRRSFDEARLKWLTGGDTINAEKKFQDEFTFTPTHKLWIAGNHKPRVAGTDEGFWRRMKLVPFTVQIPLAQVDTKLKDRLLGELPGILAWAVKGAVEWYRAGLRPPEAVEAATREYRTAEDSIGAFLEARCVEGPDRSATLALLWDAHKAWAAETGEQPARSDRALASKLGDRFTKAKGSAGVFFRGVGVRAAE